MFDQSKPYGKIFGSCGDARFEQCGKLYDREHREVRLIEQRVQDDAGVVSVVTTTEIVGVDDEQKRRGRPPKSDPYKAEA